MEQVSKFYCFGFIEEIRQCLINNKICYIQMQKQQKKVYLDLNHTFGSNFSLQTKNQIGIIQQDGKMKMVYTVGKVIVKQSFQSKTMEFIKLSDQVETIECIAISPTRNHIAVCQKIKNENFLLLNLYGLKNRDSQIKHFKLPQTDKQSTFKIIAFSPSQPKYACCMTAQPDNQLMFLDISRSRGLAVSNFSVQGTQSISICPTQSHLISCAGRNIFKLFKVEDYSFKAYEEVKKLPKSRNFTSHAWFDKTKILLGTDRGQLFMIGPVGNNFEVKRHLGNVFGFQNINSEIGELSLTAINVFSKGFIVGSSRGHFSLWMKSEENQQNFQDQYTGDLTRKWFVGESRAAKAVSIAMCPQEQLIAIAFDNNSLATTSLSTLLQWQEVQNGKVIQGNVLNYLYNGFHCGQINSLDVCLQRPIFATLSKKENMIRLWNYKSPKSELVKIFDSKTDGIQPTNSQLISCLALHPLGYYIAVGCCDKLRIYHILQNQLRNFRQILVRGVCCLRFSNGGQFLAVAYPRQKNSAQKSSVHQINIYNSYNLQEIGRLNDHSNVITDLCWRPDDRSLYSVGIDGTISEWRQGDPKSESKQWIAKKWSQSNSRYSCVLYEKTARSALAGGVEGGKSVVRQVRVQKQGTQKLFSLGGFKLVKMAWLTSQWNVPAVLGGTEDGCLKIFNSIFDNIVEQTLNVHRKEVTGIVTSPCGRYVLTTGKDGIIFVYQVSLTNRQGFVNRKLHDQLSDYEINPLIAVLDDQLADIVLVQRNDLTQKNRYNKILEKNLQQMRRKMVVQEDDDRRRYENQLTNLAAQKDSLITKLNQQLQSLKKEKQELQVSTQSDYLQTQGNNQKMLQQIEALFEKKLAFQNKKYFELESIFQYEKEAQAQEKASSRKRTDQTLQMLRREFIDCFKKAQKVHNGQQQAIAIGEKEFTQKVSQIEQEHQSELKKITEQIVHLQEDKNKRSIQYITNIQSLKRECRLLSDDIVKYMSENEMLLKQQQDLQEEQSDITKQLEMKKQDLLAKQDSLKNREERLAEYQQRMTDLQKKKEVLGYRTWEMRQEIEPKEDQIQFLKEEIYNIEKQFEKVLQDEKIIADTDSKLKKQKQLLTQQLNQQKQNTKEKRIKIKKITEQIQEIVQSKNSDKKYYQTQMQSIYQKYVRFMSQSKRNNQNPKGAEEIQRHINHIDQQISIVNKATEDTLRKKQQQIHRTTQENADLIKELTKSRQERNQLIMELRNVQKTSENLLRQTKQLRNISQAPKQQVGLGCQIKKSNVTQLQPITQFPLIPPIAMQRSSSQPMLKGKVCRGVNYDPGSLSIFTKAKLKELENKLQNEKVNLRQKQMLFKIIRQKLEQHIQMQSCSDQVLKKALEDYEV